MVCHCNSPHEHNSRAQANYAESAAFETKKAEKLQKELEKKLAALTPDNTHYTVEAAQAVGKHLVMEVLYPNCAKCAYEGKKVMVFLNTSAFDALKWKTIDPHFADPVEKRLPTSAPAPSARFPASTDGWLDAIAYAKTKDPYTT